MEKELAIFILRKLMQRQMERGEAVVPTPSAIQLHGRVISHLSNAIAALAMVIYQLKSAPEGILKGYDFSESLATLQELLSRVRKVLEKAGANVGDENVFEEGEPTA